MKRALMIASVASMIDQFNMPNIKLLEELGYEVDVACNFIEGNTCSDDRIAELKQKLDNINVRYYQIDFARNVAKIAQNIKAYKEIKKLLCSREYSLIHCHSPIGGLLTRLASRKYREKGTKVIYTAHGFHFYKGAPKKNWILYFPIEWFCSFFTDTLITINHEDFELAKKHMHAKKVEYVPGVGIDVDKFANTVVDRDKKREEIGVKDNEKMFLSVGELIPRKNHEVVLRALSMLDEKNWQYYIAGKGELAGYLNKLAIELGISDRVHLLGFRSDVAELCNSADLFIFPSLQEGLPVALMEAIASKIPVLCSKIRGSEELVSEENLFLPSNPDEIVVKLKGCKKGLFDKSVEKNYDILQKFSLENVKYDLSNIYMSVTQ